MAFTGKATYQAGADLPELAEDVSDVISLVSPHETPFLNHIGDPTRSATSTIHEWLEDTLLPNTDVVDDLDIQFPTTIGLFDVANPDRFRVGDQLKLKGKEEVLLVTGIAGNELSVTRRYGGSPQEAVVNGDEILILGNASEEGASADAARFTNRVRKQNYTQIFSSTVEVSGSQQASSTIGVDDEMDYQKQERLRELLRDLENCVLNGYASSTDPTGSRRTMQGVLASIATNVFTPGSDPLPAGGGTNSDLLTEEVLNIALRNVWEQSSGMVDTIVCGGAQKRQINGFIASMQRFMDQDKAFQQMVDVYESDYGICRILMSRWVPEDTILLLDSSRIQVLPLAGRSFQFKSLASSGDSELGQVLGEYTMEFRNENAHAVINGLGLS